MKLKFRYVFFILLSRSFISADSVRAVDSDTETVIHNALVDILSLELWVRYPNVPWSSTHRRRFAGLTDERKACLLNTCDAEKCEAVLSHFQFQALTQCSMREFKNLLRFPLYVVRNLMYSLRHDPQRHHPFLKLNDDEFTTLRGFSNARIIEFASDSELFSLLLDVGLQHFQPLHDDQLNKVFNILWRNAIKELKRFAPEQIPVLLETEHLEKTKAILDCLRMNFRASQMLEPQTTLRFLHLPLDAVKRVMYGNDQQHHPFLKLNDDEFTTLRGFSDARIIEFASDSELFSSLLDVGLKSFQPLHDDQFNNVSKILSKNDIKELKRFAPEHIPVLLETEHLEKTKAILYCLNTYYKSSEIVETKPIMQLLHLPLEAVNCLACYRPHPLLHLNGDEFINSQDHPFLKLNDDEFTTLRGFSDARIIQFASNPKVFSSLLDVGLEYFQPLHDDQFNNVFKIFWTDDIKELKRFSSEDISVLLETEHWEKSKRILHCLRTNPQASQMLEPQTTMRFLHLPLDAVKKLMHTFDPQLHGPFLHLNDDEFNEFKKFSTDRMRTLIDYSKILPDILKFGLEQVRNLPDDEFNTLIKGKLEKVQTD